MVGVLFAVYVGCAVELLLSGIPACLLLGQLVSLQCELLIALRWGNDSVKRSLWSLLMLCGVGDYCSGCAGDCCSNCATLAVVLVN